MLGAADLGAALEQLLRIVQELLLPGSDQSRMHAVERCQLADRLVSLHRGQRHLGLEPRAVRLPFLCHVLPLSWTANSSLFDCPVVTVQPLTQDSRELAQLRGCVFANLASWTSRPARDALSVMLGSHDSKPRWRSCAHSSTN